MLPMLEQGEARAFGPKDEVLRKVARNSTQIVRPVGQRGRANTETRQWSVSQPIVIGVIALMLLVGGFGG